MKKYEYTDILPPCDSVPQDNPEYNDNVMNNDDIVFSYYKHYIEIDSNNCIIKGFSDAFSTPTSTSICINEKGEYHFQLYPNGVINPILFEKTYQIPLYKYIDGKVVKRTEQEIEADITNTTSNNEEISSLDKIEAQVMYTAMMTDTLLEV